MPTPWHLNARGVSPDDSALADHLGRAGLRTAPWQPVAWEFTSNLDQVAEIEPLEDGDARVRMRDGGVVPCSRTCRHALRPAALSA